MQVIGEQQCEPNYHGTDSTAVDAAPGKGKAAMLELDRRGTGVTVMSLSCSRWIKVVRRRETRRRGVDRKESTPLRDAGKEQS